MALPIKGKICVFCGSRKGEDPSISAMAEELGRLLASEQMELVYGGGHVGIMGVIADAVLKAGGRVMGVIPQKLMDLEVAHENLSEMIVVDSMHERKRMMYDNSDAFVIIPGGIGTLDEFFEIWTWQQIGYHEKPIYLLNHRGFYDHLLKHLDSIVEAGFFSKEDRSQLQSFDDLDSLWSALKGHRPKA